MQLKRRIAREMAAMSHGPEAAKEAEAAFDRIFMRHEIPINLEGTITPERYLARVLMEFGWASSLSDVRWNIKGAGVRIDGKVVEDKHSELVPGTYVVQLGRRRSQRVTIR